jgi:hypothetical protein
MTSSFKRWGRPGPAIKTTLAARPEDTRHRIDGSFNLKPLEEIVWLLTCGFSFCFDVCAATQALLASALEIGTLCSPRACHGWAMSCPRRRSDRVGRPKLPDPAVKTTPEQLWGAAVDARLQPSEAGDPTMQCRETARKIQFHRGRQTDTRLRRSASADGYPRT